MMRGARARGGGGTTSGKRQRLVNSKVRVAPAGSGTKPRQFSDVGCKKTSPVRTDLALAAGEISGHYRRGGKKHAEAQEVKSRIRQKRQKSALLRRIGEFHPKRGGVSSKGGTYKRRKEVDLANAIRGVALKGEKSVRRLPTKMKKGGGGEENVQTAGKKKEHDFEISDHRGDFGLPSSPDRERGSRHTQIVPMTRGGPRCRRGA